MPSLMLDAPNKVRDEANAPPLVHTYWESLILVSMRMKPLSYPAEFQGGYSTCRHTFCQKREI